MDFFKNTNTLKKEYNKKRKFLIDKKRLEDKLQKLKELEKKEKLDTKKKIQLEVDRQADIIIKKFHIYKTIKTLLGVCVEQNIITDPETINIVNQVISKANDTSKSICDDINAKIEYLKTYATNRDNSQDTTSNVIENEIITIDNNNSTDN